MNDKEYWDSIAHQYDSLYDNPWSAFEDVQTAKILKRELRSATGRSVVDIGCGNGLGYRLIAEVEGGVLYTGIDISSEMILQLQRRHPEVKAICGSAEQTLELIEDESVDLIFSINTATSFPPNTDVILRQISRKLRRKGRFSLSFLNRHSLRRYISGKSDAFEIYRTRGDSESGAGVSALTMNKSEFEKLYESTTLNCDHIEYQSVLGGVWESRWTLSLEKLLRLSLPSLAHAVTFSGYRK